MTKSTSNRLFFGIPLTLFGGGLAAIVMSVFLVGSTPGHAEADNFQLSMLRVFNRVVLFVKRQYVEPQRIDPKAMLIASLEAVEKRVPEVMVREETKHTVTVHVGEKKKQFVDDDFESLWELCFKLREIFRFIESNVSSETKKNEIEYAAVNGMLSKLDPHSVLLEPRYSKEMKVSTKGEFGGLGIVISIRDGYLTVISPIEGTPAAAAGIQAQDRIVKIGEESTINMGLDEAVERLRGRPGTEIIIWVKRKGGEVEQRVPIIRAKIRVESVSSQLLENDVAYVKIKQFSGTTTDDVKNAVAKMSKKAGGDLTGMILDLRNNPGGLLDQSVTVSNLFLKDGVLVVTQDGGASGERKEYKADPRRQLIDVPLVVLVNGGSASASEIVSGAVKNRNRGLIIGEQTFGKGSVQQLYDFPDGSSLKLTIGQYLTPGDESIQSVGITPDIRTRPVFIKDKDAINLFPDMSTREEDLDSHLDDSSRIVKRKSAFSLEYLETPLTDDEREVRANSSKFFDDRETKFARRVLKHAKAADKASMVAAAKIAVEETRTEEEKRIQDALKKIGVDWTPGDAGGGLVVKVEEQGLAQAGESVDLKVTVKNTSNKAVHQVYGVTESTHPIFGDREFLFGKIEAGKSASWTASVKLPKNLNPRHDKIRVKIKSASDEKVELAKADWDIDVKGKARPRFAYALLVDDSKSGNGDGLLQVNEKVDLVVSIENQGPGIAEKPMALLKNLSGADLFIKTGRQELKTLSPNKKDTARFAFSVKGKLKKAELRLQVFDGVMGDFLVEKLELPIYPSSEKAKKQRGVVSVNQDDVAVRTAASSGASVMALAKGGSKLSVEADFGDFKRVRLGKLRGFVATGDVSKSSGKVSVDTQGQPKGLSPIYGREPPQIEFLQNQKAIVDGDKFSLELRVKDDGPVRDAYVFLGDEKVFYKNIRTKGATDTLIKTELKLEPGVNTITVVAREDDEFAHREVLSVFSRQGDPFADKKKSHR